MTTSNNKRLIQQKLTHCINKTTHPTLPARYGKVRDIYENDDSLLIVTTDRVSAFDRILTTIPYKGQVLNQLSAWWFEQTEDIVTNHLISLPYANAMEVKKINVFPIEFVVRAYITGATNTALWTLYEKGERIIYGHHFQSGLQKNECLPKPILTPTTKSGKHDLPLSASDVVKQGLMSESDFNAASAIALALFQRGQKKLANKDLILVDTKYEMGKDEKGQIVLIDELHTPDSSRYWRKSNYQARFDKQEFPDNFDKDIIRAWYKENSKPYEDKALPDAPDDIRLTLAITYIDLYETITGKNFNYQAACYDGKRKTNMLEMA